MMLFASDLAMPTHAGSVISARSLSNIFSKRALASGSSLIAPDTRTRKMLPCAIERATKCCSTVPCESFSFSMPFSLFAKCKCQNSHDSNGEKGAHLVHRHRAHIASSPLMVQHKPVIDRLDVVVVWIVKRLVRQVYGLFKEGVCNVFAHARIVIQGQGVRYSYFPIVGFVHAATLSLDKANKNVRGAQA